MLTECLYARTRYFPLAVGMRLSATNCVLTKLPLAPPLPKPFPLPLLPFRLGSRPCTIAAPSRTLLEICGACGRRCRLQPVLTQPGGLCPSFRGSCRPASAPDAPHLNSHLPSDAALLVLQNWPVSARGTYAHMDVSMRA